MKAMRLTSFPVLLIVLLLATTIRSQQFNVAGIKPYDKVVPGQVMDVLIEGLGSDATPTTFPATDFSVEVLQDGVAQLAKVRLARFTMVREANARGNTVDFAGTKMRAYQAVTFVVPKGLHPGAAEVVVSFRGQRGNSTALQIIEKPLRPVIGTMSVVAVGGMPPDRTTGKPEGNDFGWRLERGTTAKLHVNPLIDPDDPNSAILITFKQGGNDYDAVTRVTSTPARVENRNRGVGFMPAREELEVDVPAALMLGKAEVEIRLKANGLVSDPVRMTATITDMTRVAEAPNESAPRVLALTPKRIGAGQSIMLSIDQRRTLEPSPKETQVMVEQDNARYVATIEKNSALVGPSKAPDAPVGLFVRTTRQFIGRVQIRVLNPLRGEQTGLSAPVALEIVDEVLPPEVTSVSESTDSELERLRQMQAMQKEIGKDLPIYDPDRRYLTIRGTGIDYNPKFVRITLEQADQKFTLLPRDFALYSNDAVIVRLPKDLKDGDVKFTIENSGGDRYSAPVTKSFVLQSR
jgi:virulence-associated protein VagC